MDWIRQQQTMWQVANTCFTAKRKLKSRTCLVKTYKWLFIVLTSAQMIFAVVWFLFIKKFDRIIVLGSIVYASSMLVSFIAFEVVKYRKKRREMIDNLV